MSEGKKGLHNRKLALSWEEVRIRKQQGAGKQPNWELDGIITASWELDEITANWELGGIITANWVGL